jgi:AcrR family transcriptional regulator
MNTRSQHGSAPVRRRYRSELRAAQARQTRQRILEAVGALVESDPERLSIAGVARAARVSLPTVHRHFPTRRDLLDAYRLRIEGDAPSDRLPPTLTGMTSAVRAFFRRFDDPGDPLGGMRRLPVSPAWEFSRAITVPLRQAWAAEIIAASCHGLSAADRRRFSDLIVVLVSASTGEALRGYLDRSGEEAADRVLWAIGALIAHANARSTHRRGARGRTR